MNSDLDAVQLDILSRMVEADRRIPRNQRESFYFIGVNEGGFLSHPGMRDRTIIPRSDIMTLVEAGILRRTFPAGGGMGLDITQAGYKRHAQIMLDIDEPAKNMEREVQRYLDAGVFASRYGKAYASWSSATRLLYAEDAHRQLSRIGHDCTEAMQFFADALVEKHKPPKVTPDQASYIKRLDAVIDLFKATVGERRAQLLHALVNYWVAASAMAERQEHAASKAGEPVTWEDAHRVVFHTAIVMFEIDQALRR